ncbi:MAG TPA: P-loop NTPase fold protein [Nitrospira sp.]|nr:P-loop NTPase fold protein [Nitrospira sp.]
MLIRPKKLSIDPKNPFALDRMERNKSATLLTQLLERVDTPFVLALDAKWGNGKTTFVEMWRYHLSARHIRNLYFNAWETDYSADPLIAFIGEMGAAIKNYGKPSTRLTKAWKKVKAAGIVLAKRAFPVAAKVGTAGVLDLDSLSEQALAGLAADIAKDRIEKYERDKKTVKGFRAQLQEFVKILSEEEFEDGSKERLVFIVDELDRCRPTYTVELLERIKHFFDVDGLIFVLALDKEQLGHSIRAVYGAGIDVDGYLRRFLDLEYKLPSVANAKFVVYLSEQYQLAEALRRAGYLNQDRAIPSALDMFKHLAAVFHLSLRAQEQCFAGIIVSLLTNRLDLYLWFFVALAVN